MAQSGLFNILPTDYQLYLESMLPGMNEVPIGSEYFDDEMTDQIKDSTLTDYFRNNQLNTGSIGEMDYMTEEYRSGTNDPSSGTGFNKLFNTLGSYNYKFNRPSAPTFDNASIDITDRYDWNPTYSEWGYGGNEDVNPLMFGKFLWNVRPRRLGGSGFDFANTAEMAGNLFGHRASEGKGRNVNLNIPVSNETIRNYQPTNVSSNRERSFVEAIGPPGRNYNTGGLVSLVV
jgi:hypothetical protein